MTFGEGGAAYAQIGFDARVSPPSPFESGGSASGLLVGPDDAVLATGGFSPGGTKYRWAMVRWTADGLRDSSFGRNGVAYPGGGFDGGGAVPARRSDGTLVVPGHIPQRQVSALVGLEPDGSLDPSFGDGGFATTPWSILWGGRRAVAEPDGAVVVAVDSPDQSSIARFDRLGRLDADFGDGGIARFKFGDEQIGGIATVARQRDGKLVFAATERVAERRNGLVIATNQNVRWVIGRLTSNGRLDPTFGHEGLVYDLPTSGVNGLQAGPRDAIVQPGGGILVGGETDNGEDSNTAPVVVRYHPNGARDTSFGDAGVARAPGFGHGTTIELQDDGRVLLGSEAVRQLEGGLWETGFRLVRFRDDGALDDDFGKGGVATTWGPAQGPETSPGVPGLSLRGILDLEIQSSGRILATGSASECGRRVFVVLGYHSERSELPSDSAPRVRVCDPRLDTPPDGDAPVELGCPFIERICAGLVRITVEPSVIRASRHANPVQIGSAKFRAIGSGVDVADVQLTKRARRTLAARGKLRATATVIAKDGGGKRAVTSTHVLLRSKR